MKIAQKTHVKRRLAIMLIAFIGVLLATIRFNFFDVHTIPFLTATYIAHRGAYSQQIPENSLPAFQKAIDENFSIEFDVMKTKDGYPVVFHDDRLERLTTGYGAVKDTDLSDLKKLALGNSNEKIPTLEQVLTLVNGQVTLLIEIKNNGFPGKLEQAVTDCLKNYKGDIAVQSFNPLVIRWFKEKTPYNAGLILGATQIKGLRLFRDNIYSFIAYPNFLVYQYDILKQDKSLMDMKQDGLLIIPYTLNVKDIDDLRTQDFKTLIIHLEE